MAQSIKDEQFSIIRGGLLERLLILLRITKQDQPQTWRKIFFFTTLSWVPLLILNAAEGFLFGDQVVVSFLEQFSTHIRILIAIPIMLYAEILVDNRVKINLGQFIRAGLVNTAGQAQFDDAKHKADRMCESIWAEIVILGIIIVSAVFRIAENSIGLTTWAFPDSTNLHALSLAGYWAVFVCLPIFQFLVLRWLWRWIIWFRLLVLISRMDLQLQPAHPDKAGGLGFLGEPPVTFGPFTFVLGVVFAAMLAERVIYLGIKLPELYPIIGAFALLTVFINVVPLMSFASVISKARRKGIFDFSTLITKHHRSFDNAWLTNNNDTNTPLGSEDVASLADLEVPYEAVRKMNPFPFDIKIMITSIIISLLPMLPLLTLQMPVAEIFKILLEILL